MVLRACLCRQGLEQSLGQLGTASLKGFIHPQLPQAALALILFAAKRCLRVSTHRCTLAIIHAAMSMPAASPASHAHLDSLTKREAMVLQQDLHKLL